MRAALVAVGTELVVGHVVDTNSSRVAAALTAVGVEVVAVTWVADDVRRVADAVVAAAAAADMVVVGGGLGPTSDDVTRDALALAAGVPLERDASVEQSIRDLLTRLGRDPQWALRMADVPRDGRLHRNPAGTAPAVRLELAGAVVWALPGVPHELDALLALHVLPEVRERSGGAATVTRTVRTSGVPESAVAARLRDLERRAGAAGEPVVAYLAGGGEVQVRLTATRPSAEQAQAALAPWVDEAVAALGDDVHGLDDATPASSLGALLVARGATVAVAESLTAGLLGAALTAPAGSSAWFRGGLLVYATDLKAGLAGVAADLLEHEGPVSEAAARALARAARERCDATYGVATTGVAGPGPHDGHEPGTVHVAVDGPDGAAHRLLRLPGDRERVRQLAVAGALDLLRRRLAGAS